MPKFVVASIRETRTLEFREVEAATANEAAGVMAPPFLTEPLSNRATCSCYPGVIEREKFDDAWAKLIQSYHRNNY